MKIIKDWFVTKPKKKKIENSTLFVKVLRAAREQSKSRPNKK